MNTKDMDTSAPFHSDMSPEDLIREKAKEALAKETKQLSPLGKGLLTAAGIALGGAVLSSLLSPQTKRFRATGVTTARGVGESVKLRRKDLGLTQQDLAERSGTGLRFIGEVEHGKETAEIGKVLDLLDALGLEARIVPKG